MLKRTEPNRTPGIRLAAMLTTGLFLVVTTLLLVPLPPGAGTMSDKAAHLLAFAALAAPLSAVRARFAAFIVIIVSAYGGAIELLQPLVGRDAEWSDFGMDVAGALIGASAGAAAGYIWRQKVKSADSPDHGARTTAPAFDCGRRTR